MFYIVTNKLTNKKNISFFIANPRIKKLNNPVTTRIEKENKGANEKRKLMQNSN